MLLPDGERAATGHTAEGRIAAVTGSDDAPADAVTLADAEVPLSGLVDSHGHIDEPGCTGRASASPSCCTATRSPRTRGTS